MNLLKDSTIYITIQSNLGIPIVLETSNDQKIVFDAKQPYVELSTQLMTKEIDLLTISSVPAIGINDTILVKPSQKLNIIINNDKISILNNEDNLQEKRWTKRSILPYTTQYAAIQRMKAIIINNGIFAPPFMMEQSTPNDFVKEILHNKPLPKSNPKEFDQLKKETLTYFSFIKEYYENVLSDCHKSKKNAEQIFNESFILMEYYNDLDRLNSIAKDKQIKQWMKTLVNRNMELKGPFSKNMIKKYFFNNYLRLRSIHFEDLYEKTIPSDYKSMEQQFKYAIILEMIERKLPRNEIINLSSV